MEAFHCMELETADFDHEHCFILQFIHCQAERPADISGYLRGNTRSLKDFSDKARCCCFPVRSGYRHCGQGREPVSQLHLAEKRNIFYFSSLQNLHSVVYTRADNDKIAVSHAGGIVSAEGDLCAELDNGLAVFSHNLVIPQVGEVDPISSLKQKTGCGDPASSCTQH